MKTIKLSYWNEPNFGDILSPYLISKLSGKKIVYKDLYVNSLTSFKRIVKCLLNFEFSNMRSVTLPWEHTLLAIGSILPYGTRNSAIWGSGFMNNNEKFHGGNIFAVRGKYSGLKLKEMGFGDCNTYGDPALLLPLVFPISIEKENEIGIIPHWKETDYFIKHFSPKIKIIDFRTYDVESTIREIVSCKYILSTSLHGIIVSHAYGIPALWIKRGDIDTDGIKFKDYFSSVGIEYYDGFDDIENILLSESKIKEIININIPKSLPSISLDSIQRELLNSAPFNVIDKYCVYK